MTEPAGQTDATPAPFDAAALFPDRLINRFGIEHEVDGAARELKYFVQQLGFENCGAHLITCSDETEAEAAGAFQQWFAQDMLPVLRLSDRAPFRTANLGARYEWRGVAIAENHFAVDPASATRKAMVFKVHSHVAAEDAPGGSVFGVYPRYGEPSVCCGALRGLVDGAPGPVFDELREVFRSEGVDRVALLNNPDVTPPALRPLAAAVAQARLQARRVILDIQEHACETPTLYLVVASVILNRPNRDGEIVVGMYAADHLTPDAQEYYMGLGDDPRNYTFDAKRKPVAVTEPDMRLMRDARDHRELVLDAWTDRAKQKPLKATPEVERALDDAVERTRAEPNYAKIALKATLPVLIQFTPVSAAVMCFAAGAVGIHEVYRMHRIAKQVDDDAEARAVLAELEASLDHLPPERARQLVELLHSHIA
jgi:hypothetical protein